MTANPRELNWAGNYTYRAARIHHPNSREELQEIVARAQSLHALGSRHSFTGIGDAGELVSLDRLPAAITLEPGHRTASVTGGVSYAELAAALNREGVALHNLASLPHISVAGAVATASHGSGDAHGNLATAVTGLELVTGSGELRHATTGDPCFAGLVVGLGALGVVTRLTLSVEPFYELRQRVYEGLEWKALFDHLPEITASGDSVSVFHRFGERVEQVWVKRRAGGADVPAVLFGATAAGSPRHPVAGADPIHCTAQLDAPGPWSERLPHFRSGFTPSSGAEIQSEFFVTPEDAVPAIEALRAHGDQIRPLLLVAEVRTIAADELWLSPQYKRRSVGLHFTWRRSQPAVEAVLEQIETALAPFAARAHWGKLFTARVDTVAPQYERMDDFRRLRDELDPRGVFVNQWLRRRVLGA